MIFSNIRWHCWSQATNQRSCQWQNPGCLQKIPILKATWIFSMVEVEYGIQYFPIENSNSNSRIQYVAVCQVWFRSKNLLADLITLRLRKIIGILAAYFCHLFSMKICTDLPQDLSRIHFNMVRKGSTIWTCFMSAHSMGLYNHCVCWIFRQFMAIRFGKINKIPQHFRSTLG